MLTRVSADADVPARRLSCYTKNWRPKLTTLVTVDVQLRNFLSAEFETKFQTEVPLFLKIPEFPVQHSVG